mgnify:CR=1 FL=1
MVTNVTNFSRSGLYDWMAQRVSAVVLAAYTLFLLGYVICNPGMGYAEWHGLFSSTAVRIFSLLALVALSVHAWVGMWTISTDYLTPMAAEMPDIEVAHVETPTSESELGAKGAGESGTGAAPGVVMCAVNNALRPFGAAVTAQPMTPEVVLRTLGKI